MSFDADRINRNLSDISENLSLQNRLKILELKIHLVKISNQETYLKEIEKIEDRVRHLSAL